MVGPLLYKPVTANRGHARRRCAAKSAKLPDMARLRHTKLRIKAGTEHFITLL
tara:strand:+ start:4334 stop:4492 length:159 start_codon:yes stop_codon:yes gene_type:complete